MQLRRAIGPSGPPSRGYADCTTHLQALGTSHEILSKMSPSRGIARAKHTSSGRMTVSWDVCRGWDIEGVGRSNGRPDLEYAKGKPANLFHNIHISPAQPARFFASINRPYFLNWRGLASPRLQDRPNPIDPTRDHGKTLTRRALWDPLSTQSEPTCRAKIPIQNRDADLKDPRFGATSQERDRYFPAFRGSATDSLAAMSKIPGSIPIASSRRDNTDIPT